MDSSLAITFHCGGTERIGGCIRPFNCFLMSSLANEQLFTVFISSPFVELHFDSTKLGTNDAGELGSLIRTQFELGNPVR